MKFSWGTLGHIIHTFLVELGMNSISHYVMRIISDQLIDWVTWNMFFIRKYQLLENEQESLALMIQNIEKQVIEPKRFDWQTMKSL